MLVSPVPNHVILAGFVAGGVARGLCVGAVVMAVARLTGESWHRVAAICAYSAEDDGDGKARPVAKTSTMAAGPFAANIFIQGFSSWKCLTWTF